MRKPVEMHFVGVVFIINQGVVDYTGTETFAKISRVVAEANIKS